MQKICASFWFWFCMYTTYNTPSNDRVYAGMAQREKSEQFHYTKLDFTWGYEHFVGTFNNMIYARQIRQMSITFITTDSRLLES